MRLPKNVLGLAIIVVSLLAVVATVPAGAQASNANAAQGLQISPTRVDLNAARGKTYTIKLNVMNVTASDLVYNSSVKDFIAKDETGSPFIVQVSSLPATASIITWVDAVPKFTLHTRESKEITAQITIPNDAEPGGHYGVLSFSGSAPELNSTGVGLSASTGLVILIRVDGAITEKASLASFYGSQNEKQGGLFENGPVTFVTRIKNEGNIHVQPTGSVEIRDMFGGTIASLPVNKDKSNVLPNSIRRFESNFDKSWMFGLYTADLTLGYGTTGQAITNTITFWVIPYKFILLGLFILITFIYILIRLTKVYNRRIIAKSKNENTTKNKKITNKKG
ncbi:MAG: hypothetical protein ABI716_00465 [Candidatus Saccharibacteria bacterium]